MEERTTTTGKIAGSTTNTMPITRTVVVPEGQAVELHWLQEAAAEPFVTKLDRGYLERAVQDRIEAAMMREKIEEVIQAMNDAVGGDSFEHLRWSQQLAYLIKYRQAGADYARHVANLRAVLGGLLELVDEQLPIAQTGRHLLERKD